MQYIDKQKKRLIYLQQDATPDFWDNLWHIDHSIQSELKNIKSTWVSQVTEKYLRPEDGPILEGGCGTGIHVAALVNNGYRCIGVDYATRTVQTLNKAMPQLTIQQGDVRCLQFSDAYFAGYWSLGVIEHFWDGYKPIAAEMARVIQPSGYLFLTFPYMSLLRKYKAKFNLYQVWNKEQSPLDFYQFALEHYSVIQDFKKQGFMLVNHKPMLGLRAAKEELGPLNPLLSWLYNYRGRSIFLRGIRFMLSKVFTQVSGHMILLIFKKVG